MTKKLIDVLPHEFLDYRDSPAFKLREREVLHEFDNREHPWPGKHKNVTVWYALAGGKAVAWNENIALGWSFPVITYRSAT